MSVTACPRCGTRRPGRVLWGSEYVCFQCAKRMGGSEAADDRARSGLVAIDLSTVKPANVEWLWRGWIPLGMISLLIGLPGRGKTTVAESLAADLTRGKLAGDLYGHPANVLLISYEDALRETLVPRLIAADADMTRVRVVVCHRDADGVPDLTSQLDEIERLAGQHHARWLIIDPLVAGMPAGGVNAHRDQDVRSVLAPLASLAARRGLAVTGTGHFSKSAMSALVGMGGSVGFSAAARSILVFGVDPTDERGAEGPARVLAHAKCNVGAMQKSLQVQVVEHHIDPFGPDPIITVRAELGGQSDVAADDLVQEPDRKLSPRVAAQRFLRELLADGPHRAKEVISLSEDADVAIATLYRAKDDLGVASFQQGREWWWGMPDEEPDEPGVEGVEEEGDE